MVSKLNYPSIVLFFNSNSYIFEKPISGRVDRASVTEQVNYSSSIPGRVKTKTIKIGIHSFPAWRSALKGIVLSLRHVW